jgi:hypothetical protein
MTYGERLACTGLESLELRRLKQDLLHVHKILFGHIDVDPCELLVHSSGHCSTRGHEYRLLPRPCRTDLRRHIFTERVIPVWNQLAAETADFSSLKKFKAFLNVADLSTYVTTHF